MQSHLTRRALLTAPLAGTAWAQPGRIAPPTRLIIPYGAGNITDQVARVLMDVLERDVSTLSRFSFPTRGGF